MTRDQFEQVLISFMEEQHVKVAVESETSSFVRYNFTRVFGEPPIDMLYIHDRNWDVGLIPDIYYYLVNYTNQSLRRIEYITEQSHIGR